MTTERLLWAHDGRDWPHHEASTFVQAAGLSWHVQQIGRADAPLALLLHGTGASTHSWAGLATWLAPTHRLIAMDLPGHGFTDTPPAAGLSLPGMAASLSQLLVALGLQPADVTLAIGHSAGAAIAARMTLDRLIAPRHLVSLNGALLPLSGLAGQFFSPVARLLATKDWVPRLFARRAQDPQVLQRLIDGTGSTLDERGLALYGRLVRNPVHAAGALGMMANWDLRPLEHDLPQLPVPLHLVVGEGDRTVSPSQAQRVRLRLPGATLTRLPGLGHLAHEEAPQQVAQLIGRLTSAA